MQGKRVRRPGVAYLDGKGVPRDAGRAAALYRQVCEGNSALACLNLGGLYGGEKACRRMASKLDEGIIHRDLKTPNIMKDARGLVRLMDFGIAKLGDSEAGGAMTVTGQILGTPEYMSPEQIRGEKVDARIDVYALGVVIFEIFSGRVPFKGDTPISTIYKQPQDPPPLEGTDRLPPSLVPVLRKALAKDRLPQTGRPVSPMRVPRYQAPHPLPSACGRRARGGSRHDHALRRPPTVREDADRPPDLDRGRHRTLRKEHVRGLRPSLAIEGRSRRLGGVDYLPSRRRNHDRGPFPVTDPVTPTSCFASLASRHRQRSAGFTSPLASLAPVVSEGRASV